MPPPPTPNTPWDSTPPTADDLAELRERVQDFVRREITEEFAASVDRTTTSPQTCGPSSAMPGSSASPPTKSTEV